MSRFRTLAALSLACLGSTACIDETPSLHPLFAASERVPELEGTWVEIDGDARLQFDFADGVYRMALPGWELRVPGEAEPATFKAAVRFGRLSDRLFADFTPVDAKGAALDGTAGLALWPVHVFARVDRVDGRLHLARLDAEWLNEEVRAGRIAVGHEIVGEDVVLRASTEELQRLFAEWAYHPDMFEAPAVFERVR